MTITLVILTIVFPFLYKYSFVTTNQFTQIPIILSFMDRNYLINDWYVTVNKAFGPRTIFAWYLAQIAKIFSLPLIFFLHYLLYIFLIIIATYRLTYLIFKRKYTALATTICIIFGTTISLGGNILITQDFSAPQLPLGLSLLAIVFLLEKKYLSSAFLFSLTSCLHPLIGFESAFIFFSIYFILTVFSKQKVSIIIKKGLMPYLLLTLPAIYLYFSNGLKTQIDNSIKIAILAFMRNPHHYLASVFPLSSYLYFLFSLVLLLIFSRLLKKIISKNLSKFFFLSVTVIVIFCFLGFITTEIIPFYEFVVLQPFRLTIYIYWVTAIVVFGGAFYLVSEKKFSPFLLLIPIFLTDINFFSSFSKLKTILVLLGVCVLIFYKLIPRKIFLLFLILFFTLSRFHYKFNFSSFYLYPSEITMVGQWVRENTPKEAVFLVPPEFESFRLVANRAIVADWKAFPFQEKAMLEWAERMCDIGNIKNCNYKNIKENQIIAGYRTLSREDILNLADKYKFDYMISEVDYPSFNKIYNNRFRVYKIK